MAALLAFCCSLHTLHLFFVLFVFGDGKKYLCARKRMTDARVSLYTLRGASFCFSVFGSCSLSVSPVFYLLRTILYAPYFDIPQPSATSAGVSGMLAACAHSAVGFVQSRDSQKASDHQSGICRDGRLPPSLCVATHFCSCYRLRVTQSSQQVEIIERVPVIK